MFSTDKLAKNEIMRTKTIYWEMAAYAVYIALLVMARMQLPLSKLILLFSACLFSGAYIFTFRHWIATEKNIALKITGLWVMSFIPLTLMFMVMDYPGKDILNIAAIGLFIIYWSVRTFRNSAKGMISYQSIWLYVLFLMVPMTRIILSAG